MNYLKNELFAWNMLLPTSSYWWQNFTETYVENPEKFLTKLLILKKSYKASEVSIYREMHQIKTLKQIEKNSIKN